MKRRHFIRQSATAMIAIAGLPKAIRSLQDETPERYKTTLDSLKTGQWYYEIFVYNSALNDLLSASEGHKIITLKVAWFASSDFTKPEKQGEYNYIITDVASRKQTQFEKLVKTKFDKKVAGDHQFAADFPKDPSFLINTGSSAKIIDKKRQLLVDMNYTSSTAAPGTGGCFLTTACVQHQQLQDDCDELQSLRFLRKEFMLTTGEGTDLIDQYQSIGPLLVKRINECENKFEIYDYMYRHMILPSVKLVHQEKYGEAIKHYRLFTQALLERY